MRRTQFIYEHADWPSFQWDAHALSTLLAEVRHKQGRLLGRMEGLGFDLRGEASLALLTSDVVKSSAIEGENLNPGEVRSSIARRLGLDAAGLPNPGRAVEGVVEMMLDATQRHEVPLTRERLFVWHVSLFSAREPSITVGAWRPPEADPMRVVSGPFGREQVHFEAPPAERLEMEMSQFLSWFNAAPSVDPMLTAAIAHLWFVTIHPFEDGNGRIARAIADMALARADGTSERFYSMSAHIEARRQEYYAELEAAQRGGLGITRWLEWFLQCLEGAIDSADSVVGTVLHKARFWQRINTRPVNDRQRAVVNRLLDDFKGGLTTSKYAKLAKCSPDTALRDIRELMDRGVLIQNTGGGRNTSYRLGAIEGIQT